MPETDGAAATAISGQVLLELGKLSRDVAVIADRVLILPELDKRVRELELSAAAVRGSRDWAARTVAGVAVLAAVASVLVPFLHH